MPTIEIRIDDELIEVEEGDQNLAMWAQRAFEAGLQVKAWQRQAILAKGVLDELQKDKKSAYDTDFGSVIVNRISGGSTSEVDIKRLVAEFELTSAEMKRLLETASVPAKAWRDDDTNLGALVREMTLSKPRAGYLKVELGTRYAPS